MKIGSYETIVYLFGESSCCKGRVAIASSRVHPNFH